MQLSVMGAASEVIVPWCCRLWWKQLVQCVMRIVQYSLKPESMEVVAVGRALTRFRPLVRCRARPIATLQCVLHLFILLCSSTAHLCSTCVARALDRPATHTATRSEQHGLTYLQACSTTSSCATQYIRWSDVTESVATIRSPFCGYSTTDIMRWVKWRRFIVLFK